MDSIKKQIEGNAALLRFSGDQVTSGLRFTLLDDNGTVVSATTGAGTLTDEFHAFGGAVHGTPDYDTLHVLNDPDAFIIQSTNHSSTKTTNLYLRYEAYNNLHIELLTAHEAGEKTFANHSYGRTQYELTNHLGNVQTTVSNRYLFGDSTEVKLADIYTYADYYAFGMLKPERYYNPDDYGFGYQGKLMDDEIKGTGNSLDFGLRHYDSRLGRWFAPDPYDQFMSTYQAMGNIPTMTIDVDGGYVFVFNDNDGVLTSMINRLYQTEWGKKFVDQYVKDPNNHIIIGGTDEKVKEDVNDGRLKKSTKGATLYQYAKSENRHENPDEEILIIRKDLEKESPPMRLFNYIDIRNIKGNISFVMLHKPDLNPNKTEEMAHEMGAHIYAPDAVFEEHSTMQEEHDWYGDDPYNKVKYQGLSPSQEIYRELQKIYRKSLEKHFERSLEYTPHGTPDMYKVVPKSKSSSGNGSKKQQTRHRTVRFL